MVSCFCCYGAIKNLQFFEADQQCQTAVWAAPDGSAPVCLLRASLTARLGTAPPPRRRPAHYICRRPQLPRVHDRACVSSRASRASKAYPEPPIPHTALPHSQAYLLLILMEWGYSLFQIGVLHSVTFAFTYVFEVPSGLIADHFGKKNELLLCFVWYMLSFAFYSFGESSFWVLVLASGFYGLGEAFRSGTHKAMICAWLDKHEIGGHNKLQPRPQPQPHAQPQS